MSDQDQHNRREDLDRLRKDLAALANSLADIDRRLAACERSIDSPDAASSEQASEPQPPPSPPPAPIFVAPRVQPPVAPPPPPPPPPSAASSPPPSSPPAAAGQIGGFEALVGGRWSQWMGILLVFLALAWALGYSWQYLGNTGRVTVGVLSGVIFLALGSVTRSGSPKWFSEGVTGAGVGVLYLTVWAASSRYHMLGAGSAYAAMAAVTTLGVTLAVLYDAIGLMVLANIGGFLTPAVLAARPSEAATSTSLLQYVAVLDVGVVAVSLWKRWAAVVNLALAGTVLLVGGWAIDYFTDPLRWKLFGFSTLYFLMFIVASIFRSAWRRKTSLPSDLLTLFASGFAYAGAGFALLSEPLRPNAGLFPACLASFFAALAAAMAQRSPENRLLSDCCQGLAVFFLAVAIPFKFGGSWMVFGWAVQAAVLALLAGRHSSELFWWFACSLALLAAIAASGTGIPPLTSGPLQGFNLSVAAAAAAVALIASIAVGRGQTDRALIYPAGAVWSVLAGAWVVASFVYSRHWSGEGSAPMHLQARSLLLSACLLSLYGLLIDQIASRRKLMPFQITALLVLALAAAAAVVGGAASLEAGGAVAYAPVWNLRMLAFAAVCLCIALAARRRLQRPEDADPAPEVAGALLTLAALALAAGLSIEVRSTMSALRVPPDGPVVSAALCVSSAVWALVAVPVIITGRRLRLQLMMVAGLFMSLAGALMWVSGASVTTSAHWTPVLNFRFLPLIAYLLAAAWASFLSTEDSGEFALVPSVLASAGLVVALWGLTQEVWATCLFYQSALGGRWQLFAGMAISVVWTLFAVALLLVGIWRRWRGLRICGLGLLAVTVVKVFTVDLSFLDMPYRVLSFGCLGVALIGISWLYGRFAVRDEAGEPNAGASGQVQ